MKKVNNLFEKNKIRIFFLLIILGIIVIYNLYFDKKIIEGNETKTETETETKYEKIKDMIEKKLSNIDIEKKLSNIDITKDIFIEKVIRVDFNQINEENMGESEKEFLKLIMQTLVIFYWEAIGHLTEDTTVLDEQWENVKKYINKNTREETVTDYLRTSKGEAYNLYKIIIDSVEKSGNTDFGKNIKKTAEDKTHFNEIIRDNKKNEKELLSDYYKIEDIKKIDESTKKDIKKKLIDLTTKKIHVILDENLVNRYAEGHGDTQNVKPQAEKEKESSSLFT